MKSYFTATKLASATLTLALIAKGNMQRIISWISATNDKASTVLSIHKSKVKKTTTVGAASGQKVLTGVAATAGIVSGDSLVLQDAVDPTKYEIIVVDTVQANVGYTSLTNLVKTYSAGFSIYACITGGGASAAEWSFDVGIATVDKQNSTAVFVLDKDEAAIVTHSAATATCSTHIAGFLRS